MSDTLRFTPANEASWNDLQTVLSGTAARCRCEHVRLDDGPWFRMPEEQRASLFRGETHCDETHCDETHCDEPRSEETIGIVGWLDEPVAWCAVDRRGEYGRVRGSQVPWLGRHEDPDDDSV